MYNGLSILKIKSGLRFSLRNFPKYLRFFFRKIKWCWQRVTRGYCELDLWDLDHYLARLIANSLCTLSQGSYGCPCEFNGDHEAWKNKLMDIALLFDKVDELDGLWVPERDEIKDKAFSELNKYFYDLWD
jgi:hypothetical protein